MGLLLNFVYVVCAVTAASFDKTNAKAAQIGHRDEQDTRGQGFQLSRDPVEQHHQTQQDLLAAIEGGYQLPQSLEEELEQRLLLSSLLGNNGNNNNMGELLGGNRYKKADAPLSMTK